VLGKTVIRVGGGVYYGDAQIGNQLAFTYNGGNRFNLSQLTTPGLAYPVDLNPNVEAPRRMTPSATAAAK
jgi:hypothetical protein